jgi:peptidyl-prolyl cis-trans isomerase A (cyclophilin A)
MSLSRFSASRRAAFALIVTLLTALSMSPAIAQDAPKVKFSTTAGDFVVELYPDKAPKTVENFLQYVKDKHYDGTVFHRVIDNFMVQGGGFDKAYVQKPTRPSVVHEGQAALAKGGPRNVVGTVAMARTNDPQSASSQFFVNVKDNAFLDPTVIPPGDPVVKFEYQGKVYDNVPRANLVNSPQLYGYTVFAKVISGMDVINKMKAMPTGAGGPFPSDVPKTAIIVNSATLVK